MFKFTEVAVCEGSLVELVDYQNPKHITKCFKGDLEMFIEVSTGMLMFKLDHFQYGINPNDKVIYEDKDSQFKLVFCLDGDPQNCWIVKINNNVDLVFICLSERCKLIQRTASRIIIKEIETGSKSASENEEPQLTAHSTELQLQEKQKSQSTQSLLIQASKGFSKGLKLAGKVLSRGLQKLGEFISTKVEPSEPVEVSQQTKGLIQQSVKASKKILEITSEQFAALFRVGKKQAVKLMDNFEKSQKGKELQETGNYSTIKKSVKTGVHVIMNLYEGLSEGISEAATGLAKGGTKVIGAKYGQDAGQASYGVVEGARNVVGIMKVPKNEAKKMLKEEEEK